MPYKTLLLFCSLFFLMACKSEAQKKSTFKIQKSDAEWKMELTDLEYYVMREEGT